MIITHKLEMDMARRGVMPVVDAVQGDSNSRVLEVALLCAGENWTVPEGVSIRMRYRKSDGTGGIYDTLPDGTRAWAVQDNVVTMALAPQMLTAEGAVFAQLELVQDTSVLATFSIQLRIQCNPAADVLQSEDYVSMLQWMEGELDALLTQAKESGEFDGPQGEQGVPGEAGPSAYEYAVEAGFTGTEEAFARQLVTPCLPLAGGTMTGIITMGGKRITGLGAPAVHSDAVNKNYVDQKRRCSTVTLETAGWSDTAPYSMTIMSSGMTSSDWPHLGLIYTGDVQTDLLLRQEAAAVSYAVSGAGTVSFYCLERKPEIDLQFQMEVMR